MSAYALPGLFPPLGGTSCSFNVTPMDVDAFFADEQKVEFEVVARKPISSVVVKNARLDPVGYIHSLTKRNANIIFSRGFQSRGRQRRRNSEPCSPSISPKEDSMLFELSVCHNGRTYTVVRSLARIRKLRSDLIRELGCRLPEFRSRMGPGCCYRAHLPELPTFPDHCKCLGFVLIQEVLLSYTPSLQEWFRKVMDKFPYADDSLSLTDFFYEPSDQTKCIINLEKRWRHHSLPAKLSAIEESEDEDSEDGCSSM